MNLNAIDSTPLQRVRRIAAWMRALVLAGGLLVVGMALFAWASPDWVQATIAQGLGLAPERITLTPEVQLYGALVTLLPVGVTLYAMAQVWHLFGDYAKGRIFTLAASTRLRRLAWSLIAAAGVQALTRTLHGLVLTMHNPPGRRMLIVQLSSNDYAFLVFGVLLLGIAWVMVEATRLAREHAEFV